MPDVTRKNFNNMEKRNFKSEQIQYETAFLIRTRKIISSCKKFPSELIAAFFYLNTTF